MTPCGARTAALEGATFAADCAYLQSGQFIVVHPPQHVLLRKRQFAQHAQQCGYGCHVLPPLSAGQM